MDTGLVHHCPSLLQHPRLRDVWNHASFLVHISYDLDWAIGQFEMLEKEAPNCLIKAILLLNIGITHSLQAEYRKAEEAFQKVLPLHPLMAPLAHFFLGVVRFELTNYEQAQISFKLCAYILKQTDRNRAYHSLGLDFTLSHHLVVENEEIAAYEWTLKQKGRYGLRLLNRMPAPLVFNSTVLINEFEICCDRLTGSHTPRSILSSSVFSLHSESVSTMTESVTNNSIPRPVHDLTTDLSPVIPWRPFKKPMIPRTAQAETSNLRSLTHFLKYTGPEDSQTTRPEKTTISSGSMEQTYTPSIQNQAGASTKRTGLARQALLHAADQAELGSLVRKASTFTLKKTSSVRQMTRTVFSTPIERLGSANVGQSRSMERGRVIVGPQRQPTIGTITHVPNPTAHRAVFATVTEDSRETTEEKQINGRISMESDLIFSHGRLIM